MFICNYKGIDNLELEFRKPALISDPQITVIGSENGVGKTSILECCALICLALFEEDWLINFRHISDYFHYGESMYVDPARLMIRAGTEEAIIRARLSYNKTPFNLEVRCNERIGLHLLEPEFIPGDLRAALKPKRYKLTPEDSIDYLLSLLGINPEPLVAPPFLYFNSYRKIREGNPELGMLMSGSKRWRHFPEFVNPMSTFKLDVIRAMMGRGGLFESVDEKDADAVVEQLGSLVSEFTGCSLSRLRDDKRGVEIRVSKGDGEHTYPFDGLSSGQKEIICTLFLIWKYTRRQSGVVLIDEPELHLNPEWHKAFINQLAEIQPDNQYIVATHSEHVFESVEKRNRLILQR